MRQTKKRKFQKRWIILIAILAFIHFFQLPYYYSEPGEGKVLSEVINVEGGHEEDGTFMLTTVRMGKANPIFYFWAQFSEYRELYPEEQIRHEGETDEEYHHRQLMLMDHSKVTAKIVAYEHANRPVDYTYHGVLVTQVIDGMPAAEKLKAGDHIIAVDDEPVLEADELLEKLQGRTEGETVKLTVKREEGEPFDVILTFEPFPEHLQVEDGRVGVGISYPVTDRDVIFDPEVTIDSSEIGGPSAGLMFSLEIYNQLQEEDLTKGYHIAGTGSINEEGEVGRIGGVKQKIVAAHKAGADYFLAPNEHGAEQSNYKEALEAAEDIGTEMKIIPIDTFEEALQFLQSLEPRV
ncbi:SepM family pheromone-processing serine protease [Halalkalibacterium halodurans]|jgi:PDZ domain-containing protein|uniref:endopeptidase La n=2 Tax=Halalkalibacterium halodurans TaxID=86665 RepID=Q9K9Q9_HALH5|nr:SepM family pheromone-processing serine protease [Halalkalibacterium halodurans]MDY7223122.1 SepM family pheromone-processing serine protease [Halalkalibacterium halodurans]MDY7242343.1 SepM family pheromone-processing serine protease [Halalkalibacterium halodurans]MED3647271.1 SepM family pheromone-processing serine protease [Halalkalibacterium halodurans]MED4079730.1 SepM family pheromone-processing serine protease [Halalkalibacterium halodurans]MED4086328.1 SepM family pheromone-processi